MKIKVRTKEKQAIDNLKAIVNSKDKIIEIEPPIEDTAQILLDYITNLQEENKRLKEQNNDLRKIYKNTYNRLFENGNDELARYFQAQIDDCPTFYVEPIIDYAKEWKYYKSKNEKAIDEVIRVLQIILEQPSEDKIDDLWIINRLEGIQTLLQGEDKDE